MLFFLLPTYSIPFSFKNLKPTWAFDLGPGMLEKKCLLFEACGFLWPAEFAALKARFEQAMGSFGSRCNFSFDAADSNMEGRSLDQKIWKDRKVFA